MKVTKDLDVDLSGTNRNAGISFAWITLRSQSVWSKSAIALPILKRICGIKRTFFSFNNRTSFFVCALKSNFFSCSILENCFLDLASLVGFIFACFLDRWPVPLVLSHCFLSLSVWLAFWLGIFFIGIFYLFCWLFNLHLLTKCRKLKLGKLMNKLFIV